VNDFWRWVYVISEFFSKDFFSKAREAGEEGVWGRGIVWYV
jgi:hypothetical protein